MSKCNVKKKDNENVKSPWDAAIADAQQRIKDFKWSIKVYRKAKERGDSWPGDEKAGTAKEAIPA